LEVLIFFAGVIVTVFTSIEDGIYTTVCVSLALFLFRVFKARGRFLGVVKVHSVIGDHLVEGDDAHLSSKFDKADPDSAARSIFLPIGSEDGSNPLIKPDHPYPGIFIYRFSEGYNYPNAGHYLEYMVQTIFRETQRTNPNSYGRLGDRPWNDPGPRRGKDRLVQDDRPTLKAVILDFSSVNNVDITSVQNLIDVRNQLDRYAAPEKVQWHFACVTNRWTKRALAAAGFGFATPEGDDAFHRWKPIFSVAEIGGSTSAAADAEDAFNRKMSAAAKKEDLENGDGRHITQREVDSINTAESEDSNGLSKELRQSKAYRKDEARRIAVVQGVNRPFFHIDLTAALQSAIRNSEALKVKPEGTIEHDTVGPPKVFDPPTEST
jgi:sodium-independent sulfate anion transporter 11